MTASLLAAAQLGGSCVDGVTADCEGTTACDPSAPGFDATVESSSDVDAAADLDGQSGVEASDAAADGG
jgi:hypothetical protein